MNHHESTWIHINLDISPPQTRKKKRKHTKTWTTPPLPPLLPSRIQPFHRPTSAAVLAEVARPGTPGGQLGSWDSWQLSRWKFSMTRWILNGPLWPNNCQVSEGIYSNLPRWMAKLTAINRYTDDSGKHWKATYQDVPWYPYLNCWKVTAEKLEGFRTFQAELPDAAAVLKNFRTFQVIIYG